LNNEYYARDFFPHDIHNDLNIVQLFFHDLNDSRKYEFSTSINTVLFRTHWNLFRMMLVILLSWIDLQRILLELQDHFYTDLISIK
jgi:hypothetical protein